MQVPTSVWDLLMPRDDEQIGAQELLALPLLLSTFSDLLRNAMVTVAVDNQGVVGSVISGTGSAADHNAILGDLCMQVAQAGIAFTSSAPNPRLTSRTARPATPSST